MSTDESGAGIRAKRQQWEDEVRGPFVAANPERRDPFRTQALRWPVPPLATPLDAATAASRPGARG